MNRYLSLTQAAKAAKLSRQRLLVLCATGRIAGAHKIGHSWAIPNPFHISRDPRIKPRKTKTAIKNAINTDPATPPS